MRKVPASCLARQDPQDAPKDLLTHTAASPDHATSLTLQHSELCDSITAPAGLDDPTAAALPAQPSQHAWLDLHIAYHPSYQVPLLLLKGTWQDGASVTLQQLQQLLPSVEQYRDGSVPDWAYLAPMEHPVLAGQPWLCLHPCQTVQFMAVLLGSDCAVQPVGERGGGGQDAVQSTLAGVWAEPSAGGGKSACADAVAMRAACTSAAAMQLAAQAVNAAVPVTAASIAQPPAPAADQCSVSVNSAAALVQNLAASCKYLLAWFSVVGPVVGLRLPRSLWPAVAGSGACVLAGGQADAS
jgi:hypothetical protein